MNRLHITNGDSAAGVISASSVQGDVLAWRDPMHHGPFPADLELDALGDVRAKYLAGSDLDVQQVRCDFRSRNNKLRTASDYQEVVLWFEHDLLDQLQLLELMNWFGQAQLGSTLLTLICIGDFPGFENFRGLSELSHNQLETLFPQRLPVTQEQLRLGTTAWVAFRAKDPMILQSLIGDSLEELPFLKSALQRHLQEFPWTHDGLTRTERQILSLVASGVVEPRKLFVENMNLEDALYIGDWSTYRIIASLCQLSVPLLSCGRGGEFRYPPAHELTTASLEGQFLTLTDTGRAVITGAESAHALICRDEWLGGAHLESGKTLWLWDERLSCLTQSSSGST